MEPIFDLSIALPQQGSRDLLKSLHRQLRAAILDGRLQPGVRLPATRKLATLLGVSRNTAVAAYDLLLSEGYINVLSGAGAFIADIRPQIERRKKRIDLPTGDARLNRVWQKQLASPDCQYRENLRFDFRLGAPDKHAFPFQTWQRLSARSLRVFSRNQTSYSQPQGQASLREAIAVHISFTRAVACTADDLVVTAGAQQAFDLIARILVTSGATTIAVEDPGYEPVRAAFAAAGASVVAVPVDVEGMIVARIPTDTRIIYVTPSHQFPLGHTMTMARRVALLAFAKAHDAVIIEDDYDCEFRYGGRPLDALQTLDCDHLVFYIGTFSKSLFPALRLGFVASPPWARPALVAAKRLSDWHSPILEQETLAVFISEGHLARHIRKMRKIYRERRDALVAAITCHCGDILEPIAADSGLHLTALLSESVNVNEITLRAAEVGIELQSLNRYLIEGTWSNGFVFGFGMIETKNIDGAIRSLAKVLDRARPRSNDR